LTEKQSVFQQYNDFSFTLMDKMNGAAQRVKHSSIHFIQGDYEVVFSKIY